MIMVDEMMMDNGGCGLRIVIIDSNFAHLQGFAFEKIRQLSRTPLQR